MDDFAGNSCSPRHRMPFNARNDASIALDDLAGNVWQALVHDAARGLERGGNWTGAAEALRAFIAADTAGLFRAGAYTRSR